MTSELALLRLHYLSPVLKEPPEPVLPPETLALAEPHSGRFINVKRLPWDPDREWLVVKGVSRNKPAFSGEPFQILFDDEPLAAAVPLIALSPSHTLGDVIFFTVESTSPTGLSHYMLPQYLLFHRKVVAITKSEFDSLPSELNSLRELLRRTCGSSISLSLSTTTHQSSETDLSTTVSMSRRTTSTTGDLIAPQQPQSRFSAFVRGIFCITNSGHEDSSDDGTLYPDMSDDRNRWRWLAGSLWGDCGFRR